MEMVIVKYLIGISTIFLSMILFAAMFGIALGVVHIVYDIITK